MTAKVGEGRRRAFLKAYAQSGNATLSAGRAGVSISWVSLARRSDPAFDSRCRAARAASAERLAGGGSNRPPPGWERRAGVSLVVQRAGKGPPKVIRSLRTCWTPRAEDRFLGKLRQCNNLKLACGRAGMTIASYEAHWRRWPDFRRRVREARAFAGQWLRRRSEGVRGEPFHFAVSPELEAGVSIAERIRLARRHKGRS